MRYTVLTALLAGCVVDRDTSGSGDGGSESLDAVDCEGEEASSRTSRGFLLIMNTLYGTSTSLQASFSQKSEVETHTPTWEGDGCTFILDMSSSATSTALEAGTLVVGSGTAEIEIPVDPTGEEGNYSPRYLEDEGLGPFWGDPYRFSAAGGGFPAFSYDPAVKFPSTRMIITSPELSSSHTTRFSWPGSVSFTWPDSSTDGFRIDITAFTDHYYFARCQTEDDGEYEIPADLLDQFPTDADLWVRFSRYNSGCFAPDDLAFLHIRAETYEGGRIRLVSR